MSANWLSIDNNGNIGIGGLPPNNINKLYLYNSNKNSSNQLLITSTCNYANIQLNNGITSNAYIGISCSNITGNYSSNLFFETNNSIIFNTGGINKSLSIPQLMINSNGNIGINTSNPLYNLDVNGSIITPDIMYNYNLLKNVIGNISGNIYTKLRRYPPVSYDSINTNAFNISGTNNYIAPFSILRYDPYDNSYIGRHYGVGDYKITVSSFVDLYSEQYRYMQPRFLFNFSTPYAVSYYEIRDNNDYNGNYILREFRIFSELIDSYDKDGIYNGSTRFSPQPGVQYPGGWIKIQFTEPIILRKFVFSTYYDFDPFGMPSDWKCFGSMDNNTYYEIYPANSSFIVSYEYYKNNTNQYSHNINESFNNAYLYIIWVFNRITARYGIADTMRNLLEIEIYGSEINLSSTTAINISNNNGSNIPSFFTTYGSNGDRIILNPGIINTTYPYSIGINSNTMWFSVPTNGTYLWYSNLTSNMFLDNTGTLNVFNDVTCFNNASDSNLKTNIKHFDFSCIDLINKINPVEFTWKDITKVPENKKNTIDYGFIAQEVEELLPHIVKETSEYKIIKYEKMIPYLVKAIQELDICLSEYKK